MSQLIVMLSEAQLSCYLQCRMRRQAMGAWNSIQRSCNRSSTKTQALNDGSRAGLALFEGLRL